jgi:GT2 family glycosyltransferase
MPKAVKDIELTNMPAVINDLNGYDGVFLLLRYGATPVGKIILPVKNGIIVLANHKDELEKAIEKNLKYAVVDRFLFWNEAEKFSHSDTSVTIAICTRNRTDDLKLCLEALMKLPDRGQEILVVDNDPSTDDTRKLVEQYPNVRYVFEKRKGLNIARNRAIAEASNDIVVFTDDDAVVDEQWLDNIVRNFDSPLVMCVTGMTMPFELETEAQEAFENYSSFGKGFFKKRYSFSESNPLATGGVGAGANMAIRTSVVKDIGWFDEALDSGTPTQSGGDHEFFARILLAGYQIIYDPEALSWHRHRRSWKEAIKAIYGYGVGVYAFWTRLLFIEKQYAILSFPKNWLLYNQLPDFYKSVLGIKKIPLSFFFAEFRGCLKGPFAYFKSRKQANNYLKKQGG